MVDQNTIFGGMLTNLGAAKKTNCDALGVPWEPRYMLIGDANGTDPVPNSAQTQLVHQVYRAQLNQLYVSPADDKVLVAELVLPPDVGGWWVRELALEDKDGIFSAVANVAPSYKPQLAQNSGRNQVVRMHIITNGTGNIQLKIDPSVVLATRQYVDVTINGLLPANKTAGTYTKVTVNDRGVFVSGSNPNTLAGMGITDTFTKAEVESMIAQASALPVGTTVAFPVNKLAPGFLELDGSVKSVAAYPDLATFLGTAFNLGNEGTGNFRLPESRGEFLRGWDHGRGVDPGRAIGSAQIGSYLPGDNNASDEIIYVHNASDKAGLGWDAFTGAPTAGTVRYHSVFNETVPDPTQISGHGGAARPRNVAVMWCIKAWNAPINQGNIDIAALVALAAQATEINQGTAKVATDAQMLDSANDAVMATPKKLRKGFAISLAAAGYIAFPTWLGGLILQWSKTSFGNVPANGGQSVSASWPITFPNAVYLAGASCDGTGAGANTVGAFVFNVGLSTVGVAATNFSGAIQPTNGTFFWGIGR